MAPDALSADRLVARAHRFGVTPPTKVLASEPLKAKRAERFGAVAAAAAALAEGAAIGTSGGGEASDAKAKRAARFGVAAPVPVASVAITGAAAQRAQRFGTGKASASAAPTLTAELSAKNAARAARFAQ